MNRLGWIILGLIALAGLGFALLIEHGGRHPDLDPESGQAATVIPSDAMAIPVAGIPAAALHDSWHDARESGARVHEAIDIAAPGGTPVLAAQAGTVEKLFESRLGGTTAYVRSQDRLWVAYYAHLASYMQALHEGQAIVRGQQIGFVGDTGDAGPGNTHLHFALARMAAGERWYQGTPVNPYPLLAQGRAPR